MGELGGSGGRKTNLLQVLDGLAGHWWVGCFMVVGLVAEIVDRLDDHANSNNIDYVLANRLNEKKQKPIRNLLSLLPLTINHRLHLLNLMLNDPLLHNRRVLRSVTVPLAVSARELRSPVAANISVLLVLVSVRRSVGSVGGVVVAAVCTACRGGFRSGAGAVAGVSGGTLGVATCGSGFDGVDEAHCGVTWMKGGGWWMREAKGARLKTQERWSTKGRLKNEDQIAL